jgi:uncharacterized membrane protein
MSDFLLRYGYFCVFAQILLFIFANYLFTGWTLVFVSALIVLSVVVGALVISYAKIKRARESHSDYENLVKKLTQK